MTTAQWKVIVALCRLVIKVVENDISWEDKSFLLLHEVIAESDREGNETNT